jgi:hypothetical protein
MSARNFFEKYLRPNFEEWATCPADERRAMNAVLSLNQMADWFFYENKTHKSQVGDALSVGQYRDHLVRCECADFQIIRDVAEAHKHFMLKNIYAKVKRAEDTSVQKTSYFAKGYVEEGYIRDEDELVVDIGDGDLRSLMSYAQNVYKMWGRILDR